jgi:hypothetical protein
MNFGNKIITDGLVLCLDAADLKSYPGSGNIWYDRTRNKNNGTIYNGEFVAEVNGGYLRNLNNTSDFFNVGISDSSSLNSAFSVTTGGWTIEEIIWTNSVTYPEADAGGVASGGAYSPAGATGFDWNHGTINTAFRFGQSSNSNGNYEVDNSFTVDSPYNSLNAWRIRTMIWNRTTNRNELYVNGVYQNYVDTSATSGTAVYDGGGIVFGALYGWKHYGRRAAIKVYSRILSASEIQQNFNAQRKRFNI